MAENWPAATRALATGEILVARALGELLPRVCRVIPRTFAASLLFPFTCSSTR